MQQYKGSCAAMSEACKQQQHCSRSIFIISRMLYSTLTSFANLLCFIDVFWRLQKHMMYSR
jgi:hypothetical protein